MSSLSTRRATAPSIDSLPPELLSEIFEYCILFDESDAKRANARHFPVFNSMNAASPRDSPKSIDDTKTIRAISRTSKYLSGAAEPFRFRTLFITVSSLIELMRTIRSKIRVKGYIRHLHVIIMANSIKVEDHYKTSGMLSLLLSLTGPTLQTLSVVLFEQDDARRLDYLHSILKTPFLSLSVFLLRINKISVLPATYYSEINMPVLRDLHVSSLAKTDDQWHAIAKFARRLLALTSIVLLGPFNTSDYAANGERSTFRIIDDVLHEINDHKKYRQLRLPRTVRRVLVSEQYGAYHEKDTQGPFVPSPDFLSSISPVKYRKGLLIAFDAMRGLDEGTWKVYRRTRGMSVPSGSSIVGRYDVEYFPLMLYGLATLTAWEPNSEDDADSGDDSLEIASLSGEDSDVEEQEQEQEEDEESGSGEGAEYDLFGF